MSPRRRLRGWQRWLFHAPTRLYEKNLGWLLGRRFVCFTHRGRHSGRTYRTVVEVVDLDARTGEIVVASGFGPEADWYRNLRARPALEVQIARRRFVPEQRLLTPEEAEVALQHYRRRHPVAVRFLGRSLGRLNDVAVDGSPASLRLLAERMPMVGFRPPAPA